MIGKFCPFIWIGYNTAVLAKAQAGDTYTIMETARDTCLGDACALWDPGRKRCAIKSASEALLGVPPKLQQEDTS